METSPVNISRNHDHCFVCGKKNPCGLGVDFTSENELTTGSFIACEGLESINGVIHGGILTSLMDAAMTRWLFDRGVIAFTAILKVRFRIAVSPGQQLHLIARNRKQRGRRFYMEARLYNGQDMEVASSEALFLQSGRPVRDK